MGGEVWCLLCGDHEFRVFFRASRWRIRQLPTVRMFHGTRQLHEVVEDTVRECVVIRVDGGEQDAQSAGGRKHDPSHNG